MAEIPPTLGLVDRLVMRAVTNVGPLDVAAGEGVEPNSGAPVPECLLNVQDMLSRMVYEHSVASGANESAALHVGQARQTSQGLGRSITFPNGLQARVHINGDHLTIRTSAARNGQCPTVHVDERPITLEPRHGGRYGASALLGPEASIKIGSDGVFVRLDRNLEPQSAERQPSDDEKHAIDQKLARLHERPELAGRFLEGDQLASHIKNSGKKVLAFSGFVNSGYFDVDSLLHLAGKVLDQLDPQEYIVHTCGFTDGIGRVARLAKERGFETTALRARISDAQISPSVDRYTLAGYSWEEASHAFGDIASLGHLIVIGGNHYSQLEAGTAYAGGGWVTNVPYYADEAGNLAGTHTMKIDNAQRWGTATRAADILPRVQASHLHFATRSESPS